MTSGDREGHPHLAASVGRGLRRTASRASATTRRRASSCTTAPPRGTGCWTTWWSPTGRCSPAPAPGPSFPTLGTLQAGRAWVGAAPSPPPSEGLMSCPSPSLGGPRCDLMQFLSEFVICFLSHPRGPAALLFFWSAFPNLVPSPRAMASSAQSLLQPIVVALH